MSFRRICTRSASDEIEENTLEVTLMKKIAELSQTIEKLKQELIIARVREEIDITWVNHYRQRLKELLNSIQNGGNRMIISSGNVGGRFYVVSYNTTNQGFKWFETRRYWTLFLWHYMVQIDKKSCGR
jgi:hypothetical protein